jgi:two-component system, NarL family, response regulator DesR
MIRVLLVEDAPRGLATPLGREDGIVIVGRLDFEDGMQLAAHFRPDVVLFNTDFMVSQVLPVAAELRITVPGAAILVVSDPDKRGMLPPRRRSPELSFVVRGTPVPAIAEAVRRVARGERVVDARLQVASIGTEKAVTTREWEVLGLAAQGESVADIAGRLYLSQGTIRNYLSSVIRKTGARNRLDAIRIARKGGWLR